MPSIEKILIRGFKAFPNEFTLKLDGKHLLMYGENGSGKSSIYFALHCLYQSSLKSDAGKKYFNALNEDGSENHQHLLNRNTLDENAFIKVYLKETPWIYTIDKKGCTPELMGGHRAHFPIECCFVNHNFIFCFFNFRNSENINLFPVFLKDILSFYVVPEHGIHIIEKYDYLTTNTVPKNGKAKTLFLLQLESFNQETKRVVENINLTASDRYNHYFKDENDRDLQIRLRYDSNAEKRPEDAQEYWLKYDNIFEEQIIQGVKRVRRSTYKKWNIPFIGLEISEKLADGTCRFIPKPQSYFNEAKLTAIALSIRFSLLNLDKPADGRFLALDDMLISLDMSNRAKVVDFLLSISDKYKIYLFTHDKLFFEHLKERVLYFNKARNQPEYSGWLIQELYNDENPMSNPKLIDSESDIAKALRYYKDFDYPASANYLRKAVENLLQDILPDKLSRQDNGDRYEKLRNTLDASFKFFQKIPEFDLTDLSRLISNLNLLLNPLSHKSTETNVYKTELKEIFAIIERLRAQIIGLRLHEVLPRSQKIYMYFVEDEHITQRYELILKTELYTYEINGIRHIYQPETKSARSCTITDGMEGDYTPNSHYKGTLEKICQDIHTYKRREYANNYIDFYKDKDGTPLSSLI